MVGAYLESRRWIFGLSVSRLNPSSFARSPPVAAKVSLRVAGVFSQGEGYPNVKHRLEDIRGSSEFRVDEVSMPWPSQGPAYVKDSSVSRLRFGLSLVVRHTVMLARWARLKRTQAIYLPYPAILTGWCLSWLPKRMLPPIVIDAFISWHDTVVHDRKLATEHSAISRLLWWIEQRAYRTASLIIVDTEDNASELTRQFGLISTRVRALRLAIDEDAFVPSPYEPGEGPIEVLFAGTFVPLQGVDVIARAIRELDDEPRVHFRLIGDGQMASSFVTALGSDALERISWERTWQDSHTLCDAIASADICLGIFGTTNKAARVWPLKNYLYMRVGRAIITADSPEARRLQATLPEPCFELIPSGDPIALARAIQALAIDASRRQRYAVAAAHGFQSTLSRSVTTVEFNEQIISLVAPCP